MRTAAAVLVVLLLSAAGVWKIRHRDRAAPKQLAPPATAAAPPASAPPRPKAPGFIGVVLAGDWVQVEPNVSGRIDEVFVKPGDEIPRGAKIAQLDVRSLRHELAVAQASAAEASGRLARRARLVGGGISAITPEELDNARYDVAREQARVASLSRTVADATVVAPFAGAVTDQYLSKGALAGPGRPIVRLLGKAPPRVRFAVPEEQARGLAPEMAVAIEGQSSDIKANGSIVSVTPEVDNASGMVYATANVSPGADAAAQFAKGGLIVRVFAGAASAQ